MLSDIIVFVFVLYVQRRIGAFLSNRISNDFLKTCLSIAVVLVNCLFSLGFAVSTGIFEGEEGSLRYEIGRWLSRFDVLNYEYNVGEHVVVFMQTLGFGDPLEQCGMMGAVHYKLWDAQANRSLEERSQIVRDAIGQVVSLNSRHNWLRDNFYLELKDVETNIGYLRTSTRSICAASPLRHDVQAIYHINLGNLTLQ